MLEKNNRICLNKEFDRVFKTGHSFYAKELGIKLVENDREKTRFGILVGLKVSKKAVARNKIKRQIRAIIRENIPLIKDGKDIIIVTLPEIINSSYESIEKSLRLGFKKLNLYKN
ncbi:MAG: ribonuclease P protein component [Patescibacteria group bacterium]